MDEEHLNFKRYANEKISFYVSAIDACCLFSEAQHHAQSATAYLSGLRTGQVLTADESAEAQTAITHALAVVKSRTKR